MATVVTGWLSPVLVCASILLLARSFYMIYVRKIGTRPTIVITWLSLMFITCFWTWYLALGGSDIMRDLFQPGEL